MRPTTACGRLAAAYALIVLALLASALFVGQRLVSANDGSPAGPGGADDEYINYVAPQIERSTTGKEVKGKDGVYRPANKSALDQATAIDRKYAKGNPVAARQLAKLEAEAIKTGKSPRKIQAGEDHPGGQAADDPGRVQRRRPTTTSPASMVPRRSSSDRDLRRRGTVQNGPPHNNIPNPADVWPTRTTTRCGCRTSRPRTTTRCSTPRRASPSGSAPT